jgi:uncharacterized protein (TIGR04141 family)
LGSMRLTVFLMRDDVVTWADALSEPGTNEEFALKSDAGLDGIFVKRSSPSIKPMWATYLAPIVEGSLDGVRAQTSAGILLLRAKGRMFALTFGYGRSMLDLARIEPQFGLRVVLNSVDANQLRSIDTKTFDDVVVSTTKQLSRDGELPAFGVDVSTDILRAVTGRPRNQELARRLSGADALVVAVERKPEDLSVFCAELLDLYSDTAYESDFGWIDQLKLVRDPQLVDRLDEMIVSDLRGAELGSTHMAAPEPLAWEDVDAFKIAGTRSAEYDDLDLAAYLDGLAAARARITLADLKQRRVSVRYARDSKFIAQWVLYRCLVSEQVDAGNRYVLVEGRWFQIAATLVDEVDGFLGGIPSATLPFVPSRPGEAEGKYNERLAAAAPDMIKLDAKILRAAGASSGIEVCDVLTSGGAFVHVKRKSRSSTLSHLFAQGAVSATTFVSDGAFRDRVRERIQSDFGSSGDPWLALVPPGNQQVKRNAGYQAVFGVIANSTKSGYDWLPFFSKLNLMQATKQLRSMGFEVTVCRVPIEEP